MISGYVHVKDWLEDVHPALIPDRPRAIDLLIFNPFAFYGSYQISTNIGQRSAEWYAEKYNATHGLSAAPYAIGGAVASTWTPDTAPLTVMVMAGGWASAGWAAETGPWLGTAAIHPPHHGLGKHFEVIIRGSNGKNFKLILPGKDFPIWVGRK